MRSVTLSAIRKHSPCAESWEKLLRHLGKTRADETEVPLVEILDLLGLDDCLWALRALPPEDDAAVRLLVCDLVEPALQYTDDPRPRQAVETARRYAHGEATAGELSSAGAAARAAARAEKERILRAWLGGDHE